MKIHRALFILLVIASVLRPANADRVDDYIRAQMQNRQVPGLSLAIIRDGKIVKVKGYGVTEKNGRTPVTPETLFQAGSISKPVAALGALHLVEQGKLALDEDVNARLQTWKVPENEFTNEKKVTLRGLLSHTAGLTVHGFPGYATDASVPTVVQILNGEKPANTPAIRVNVAPGSLWRYSGGGYTVMQQMVVDVTGKPYPQFMHEAVLRPLRMSRSTYEQPLPADMAKATATGHYGNRSLVQGRWHIYPEMAAAGLWTTPSDLARFAIEIQNSLAGTSNKAISREMTRQMLTVQKNKFGLGVTLDGSERVLRFSHGGRDEGFDAFLVAYAETGHGVVLMINANDNSRMIPRIVAFIAKEYGWPEYPVYTAATHKIVPIDPKTLEAYTGRYESANNQMFTLVAEKGRLYTQADGLLDEEFLPEAENQFFSTDRDFQLQFVKDANGFVIGFTAKIGGKERKVPRIGPLIHTLKPQTDSDPTLTQRVLTALQSFAQGGKAVEGVSGITPGARRDFASGTPEVAGIRSLTFIATEEISERGIERHEGKIARIRYYKLSTEKATRYILVHLTADNLVTDYDVVDD